MIARHGLDEFIFRLGILRPYRFLRFALPIFWFRRPSGDRGQRLRQALEELGPIFVKFGQALSTRPDLIPPDIAAELTRLQDRVPPFSGEDAREVIERSLDAPSQSILQPLMCSRLLPLRWLRSMLRRFSTAPLSW